MSTRPIRVGIYLRVSKDDGSQETDNQLIQLREFCEWWEGDRGRETESEAPDVPEEKRGAGGSSIARPGRVAGRKT